jgi:hypothetical protein
MLKNYTYQIQFTVHYEDGRKLTECRNIRASSSEEVNAAFIEILKNEYPNLGVDNLKIHQVKE